VAGAGKLSKETVDNARHTSQNNVLTITSRLPPLNLYCRNIQTTVHSFTHPQSVTASSKFNKIQN